MAAPSFPPSGSRSDATRKHVLEAIAEQRRAGGSGKDSKADTLRVGESRGTPFSRRSLDKYGRRAFRTEGHRSVLRARDTIERRADVITYQRGIERDHRIGSSTDASKVSRWQNAMGNFLHTGDDTALAQLSEEERTIDRGRSVLVNDPDEIQTLADSGALDQFRTEAGS